MEWISVVTQSGLVGYKALKRELFFTLNSDLS